MAASSSPAPPRRRASRWLVLGLVLTVLASVLLHPALAHWALRTVLERSASRRGLDLRVEQIGGSLWDTFTLTGVRLVDLRHVPEGGTDLRAGSVEITPRWFIPFLRTADAPVERVVLDGLRGTYVFHARPAATTTSPAGASAASPTPRRTPDPAIAAGIARWLPASVVVQRADVSVVRGNLAFRARNLRVFADGGAAGWAAATSTEFTAGTRTATLPPWRGGARWQRPALTVSAVELGSGVRLVSANLDLSRLAGGRLDSSVTLDALGGTLRGQVEADFAAERPVFDVAGSLSRVAFEPVARLLGRSGPFAGFFDEGQFSFRGDPADPAAAALSLRAQARGFRWRERQFESLSLAGTLVNRRLHVQQFDLQQKGNDFRFSGETTLPERDAAAAAALIASPDLRPWLPWLLTGFTLNIDARLDDLRALAQLVQPGAEYLSGRMTVVGTVKGRLGELDGTLSVEAGPAQWAGLPLDSLRATLGFKGDEVVLTDLQAAAGKADTLSAKGVWAVMSSGRFRGELRTHVDDLGRYAALYQSDGIPGPLAGALSLEWSGDGTPRAHSGAFKVAVEKFSARRAGGRGAFARPTDLTAEGTYSPAALALRSLVLREGKKDVLKLEGTLPWTQDRRLLADGKFFDPSRPFSLRGELIEAPLDLLPFLTTSVRAADGRASGKVEVAGTARAPRLTGSVAVRGATVEWDGPSLAELQGEVVLEGAKLTLRGARGRARLLTPEAPSAAPAPAPAATAPTAPSPGAEFQAEGGISWDGEPVRPTLDLLLRAERVPWRNDPDLAAEARLEWVLRGSITDATLAGRAVLRTGSSLRRPLMLVEAAQAGEVRPPEAGWFAPAALAGGVGWLEGLPMEIHVSASPEGLRLPAANAGGTAAVELTLRGTLRETLPAGGRLTFTGARAPGLPGVKAEPVNLRGAFTWSAAGDAPPAVQVSAELATPRRGAASGLSGQGPWQGVEWTIAPPAAPLSSGDAVPVVSPSPAPAPPANSALGFR